VHALGKGTGLTTDDQDQPVAVSRRIGVPAHDIFQVLADPVRHPEFDGSQSLRGAGSAAVISGVGDVFVLKMYFSRIGKCETKNHVVEPGRRIGWEPEAGRGHRPPPPGQFGADPLGVPVELPAHPRWPGCDRRDGNLRLLTGAARRTCRDGQRQHLDPEHDPGHGSGLTRCAPGQDTSPAGHRPGWTAPANWV
jgi:hypothetical protein